MHIVLFEDHITAENRPITLARPAFAVSMAGSTLHDIARDCGSSVGAVVRDYLQARTQKDFDLVETAGQALLLLNASLVPSFSLVETLLKEAGKAKNFLVPSDARVAAAFFASAPDGLGEQTVQSIAAFLLAQDYKRLNLDIPLVAYPQDLIRYHQKYFSDNIIRRTDGLREVRPGVFVGDGVKIHPTAVLEADKGPIVLHDKVSVGPFALLEGPLLVEHDSRIIERATVKEQVQIGHTCKIGGEVECSVVEAYSNKQHHGFLGHSWIGRWVNLGAGTTTSDLKNTYGNIRMDYRGNRVDTGMQLLGSIIGDYVKTAVNTSIFTGKIVGVSSMIYGMVTTNVPSFSNYARSFGQVTEISIEQLLITQKRMFSRRGVKQTAYDTELMRRVFEMTRNERVMSEEQINF